MTLWLFTQYVDLETEYLQTTFTHIIYFININIRAKGYKVEYDLTS